MIRIINAIAVTVISFGIYAGVRLYQYETTPVPQNNIPPINKKIEPPKEVPKSFAWKKLSKLEMIDSSDVVVEEHINQILNRNKYKCMGMTRDVYVTSISSAVLNHTKGNIKLALWVTAMAQVESSYRLTADPKVSSARGFLQVIPRYHKKELAKAGITSEDLYTDPSKSIKAGIIVFQKYLAIEHGNYQKATRRYRGLSVPEKEQQRYYTAIKNIYNKLLDDLHEYA